MALSEAEAFESRIQKTSGCWLWIGAKSGVPRYGVFQYGGKRHRAHVFALALDNRPVPKGMSALHHCDNPMCVRPSHLYVGTQRMNNLDAWERTRTDYGVKHHSAKLTPAIVREMRTMHRRGVSFAQIARTFNVSAPTASFAAQSKSWKSVKEEGNE